MREGPDGQRGRRTLLGVAVVVAVVLMQLLAQYVSSRDVGRLGSVLLFFLLELPLLVLVLSSLFGWARRRGMGPLPLVAMGLVIAGSVGAIVGAAFWQLHEQAPGLGLRLSIVFPLSLGRAVLFGFTQALSHFGLWTLAFVLPSALEDARVRSLETDKLRLEASQLRSAAELARLRANLEPHFLLNTLNAIAGLVTEEPREARRLLSALGDLLRDALADEDELQTLAAQVTWLRRYAQILEARHRGELTFTWEIAPDAEGVQLPRLLLQPLVENAVQHGALKGQGPGHVTVRAALAEGGRRLCCAIEDDGPGLGDRRDGGFGVQSVERRIALRYGEGGRLRLEGTGHGTRATVEVPVVTT